MCNFICMCTYMYRPKTILYMEWQSLPHLCEIVCLWNKPALLLLRRVSDFQSPLSIALPGCLHYSCTWISVLLMVPLLRDVAPNLGNFQSSNFLRFSGNCHFNNTAQYFCLLQSFFSSLLKIQESAVNWKDQLEKTTRGWHRKWQTSHLETVFDY